MSDYVNVAPLVLDALSLGGFSRTLNHLRCHQPAADTSPSQDWLQPLAEKMEPDPSRQWDEKQALFDLGGNLVNDVPSPQMALEILVEGVVSALEIDPFCVRANAVLREQRSREEFIAERVLRALNERERQDQAEREFPKPSQRESIKLWEPNWDLKPSDSSTP
jgi:hypothetical protein